jgi:peptidoglycan/LPS O-acetylase OafA/YrhL
MDRIPSLDGFRAISILLVLIAHSRLSVGFPEQFYDFARHGAVGVTVFFVISGFLITNLLFNEETRSTKISIRGFYIRRAFRIIPVFFLYIVFVLIWQNFEVLNIKSINIIHALTFTENFDKSPNWFLGHFWTLSIEEQFYLFWPLTFVFFRNRLKLIVTSLIIYSCLVRALVYKIPQIDLITLHPFFEKADAIFVGVLGAIYLKENPNILNHRAFRSYLLKTCALILIITLVYAQGYGKLAIISLPAGNLIISVAILFLLFAYIIPSKSLVFKFLNHKYIIHIGVLSYSLYIWQQVLFVGDGRFAWKSFPVNWLVIYVVALLSYYLWEKPFIKFGRYVSRQFTTTASDKLLNKSSSKDTRLDPFMKEID